MASTLISATVNVQCLPTFRHPLTPGSMFFDNGFDITQCNQNFRLQTGKSDDSEVFEAKGYLLIIRFLTISPSPETGVKALETQQQARNSIGSRGVCNGRSCKTFCGPKSSDEMQCSDHTNGLLMLFQLLKDVQPEPTQSFRILIQA
ncbi:hypothetical protein Bca52824_016790 [Brassica carinata]|uniref:Uncharacterized protein n=1 Tax=Brassica carinata TaxID=52824 RepID=A0A8X8B704_BRACI|nr:hypothetical protein Bca52824_016790 [Brassica carinata]